MRTKKSRTPKQRPKKKRSREPSVPLNEDAYLRIRSDVLTCALAPGTRISESRLSQMYGLGKAPIRNALARLQQTGLVSAVARQGYQIAPVTLADIRDVFQLRLILEPAAARLAAGHLSSAHVHALKRAMSVRYVPGDRTSEHAFLNANRLFHVTIAEASGSERLATWIGQLLDSVERMLHMGLALQSRGPRFQEEHLEMFRALLAGDGEAAARLAQQQLTGGLEMVIEAGVSDT